MITCVIQGHPFMNEVQTISQVFYPNRKYCPADEIAKDGLTVVSMVKGDAASAHIYEDGRLLGVETTAFPLKGTLREQKRSVKAAIYQLLKKLTGYRPQWGMQTGIRPTKMVNELLDLGYDTEYAAAYLKNGYDVSEEKVQLAVAVAKAERAILQANKETDASVYIGIPFCPTRCLYCSFTAYPLEQYKNRIELYLEALKKELEFIGEQFLHKTLKSVYIGGGTPTSLNEKQMEGLLKAVQKIFPSVEKREFTVEAGRPDTITREKLAIMKAFGVNRISINPQTMNQSTLERVGRRHTVADIISSFQMAREEGHKNINMDLILGLPGEGPEEVAYTMEQVKKLQPENLTVHTLAVKRASRLKEELSAFSFPSSEMMEEMLSVSYQGAVAMGMTPYYMYRQKNMVGSFENVGYCLPGKESIYNVEIMEEKQTIFAAGAGASTKLYYPKENRIERVFNVKNVEEYMNRIDEMIKRKQKAMIK